MDVIRSERSDVVVVRTEEALSDATRSEAVLSVARSAPRSEALSDTLSAALSVAALSLALSCLTLSLSCSLSNLTLSLSCSLSRSLSDRALARSAVDSR